MLRRFALLAALLAASPASAFDSSQLGQGGTWPLSDLMGLVDQSAQLKREVKEALGAIKKKASDITCTGNQFPDSWVHLAGKHVAPYDCDFGNKWLAISAKVRVTGRRGRAYDVITNEAMKNALSVTQTSPFGTWTTGGH